MDANKALKRSLILKENIFEAPVLTEADLPGALYEVTKRISDLFLSTIALVVSAPVMVFIALVIRLDSPGPAVFRHQRVGKNGKIFAMYKFRTMYIDTSEYAPAPTNSGDERVTKLGRFLRKLSLDELPQLFNILKGEMSLVGPRPEQPFIVEKYSRKEKKRLIARPGLSGLWQVSGRMDIPPQEMMRFDLLYIEKRSFLFDLLILLRTIPAVISGRGAY